MTTAAPTSVAATASPTTTATTAAPTTAPPTTAEPTTLATSVAPTSVLATKAPTTFLTSAAPTTLNTTAAPTTAVPVERNPDLDVTFNCKANNWAGALIVTITIDGHSLNASYGLDDGELAVVISISGDVPTASLFDATGALVITIALDGWGVANDQKSNWVGWSKIGEASFILDKVNDAGFKPMSWSGYVYQVLKLDKNIVIYGSGGVTMAIPVQQPAPTFGFKDLLAHGVMSKTAVVGNQFVHFFIDIVGALYRLTTEGLEYLGYEEFLSELTNPNMVYDSAERRLYISDADNNGYVFHEDAMTGGHTGLTGLYRVKEDVTMVGPDEIVVKPVYVTTDILDFKRRGMKQIESLQFGTSADMPLYAAIDYRFRKSDSFRSTKWVRLNDEGAVHLPCAGIEFRVKLKAQVLGEFDLAYIKIQHKYIDQRFTRDFRGEPLDAY